jgi:release factor H-coupled RctB family protein
MGNSTVTMRGPKVRVFASPSTWIEGEALRQLDAVAELPGMVSVAGMPDLHPGKGGPVGVAILSDGFVHPSLVGSDIGCSMSLLQTGLPLRKARAERLAERLKGIDGPWDGDTAGWLAGRGLDPTPYDATLGTTGRGNHFIEFLAVEDIRDPVGFAGLGLERDRVHLLIHSGSRGLGESVLRGHADRHGAAPLAAGTPDASAYLAEHERAVRWAVANRALCARRACEAVGTDAVGVLDVCHNSVTEADFGGRRYWLHRKGAVPSDMGPVIIPGSRGDLSWLVRPVIGRDEALRSLAHGAGRKIARHEARAKLKGLYRREDLRTNPWGGRVVCTEELAWEECPEAYKPIASVVGDLVSAGLAELIASFRPVVTFKTSEEALGAGSGGRREKARWQQERREARAAKCGRFA